MLRMQELQWLSANIARLMSSSGLDTQMKLAKAAGLSQTNLSNIIRKTVNPQLDTIAMIARALKVDTWQLLAPPDPSRLLELYSAASPESRAALLKVAESLAGFRPDEN